MNPPIQVMITLRRAWSRYVEFHARAPFKHVYLSYIGLVTYPAYYVVWRYVFPQPYENLTFRLIGVGLCVAYLLRDRWPARLKRWYYPFTYISMMLGLPTFFTFMTLKNSASPAWLMSTMAAFVFVVLVYDVANVFVVSIVGSMLGIGLYFITDGVQPLPVEYLYGIPIFLFTVCAVVFLAYSERLIAREQFTAAELLASSIAHEMRTPLLGIRLDCERVRGDLSGVFPAADWAARNGYEGPRLSQDEAAGMQAALARIRDHALGANLIIEMLLANVAHNKVEMSDFEVYSYRDVLTVALDRFHFQKGQAQLVRVHGALDARFWGSQQLMVHVIFNLLRNALKAIAQRGTGSIDIGVSAGSTHSELTFADDGPGIRSDLLPLIFMPFVTGGSRMQGTGVGLAFCKMVVEAFGGTITCTSEVGAGTRFVIRLPNPSTTKPVKPLTLRA